VPFVLVVAGAGVMGEEAVESEAHRQFLMGWSWTGGMGWVFMAPPRARLPTGVG
jgi:dienelactone hydrolase